MLRIKSKYKIAKRLGAGVFEKTQTQKFALSEARGRKQRTRRPRQLSDYGRQLIEKQKVRFTYGLSEKQLTNYVKASMHEDDPTGTFHRALELRLDNVVYRLGLAPTRRASRQMVSHGHITVNGRRMTIPSHRVRVGDTIAVREGSRDTALFANLEDALGGMPDWLTFDPKALSGSVKGEPAFQYMEGGLDYAAVFEFYSR